MDSYKQIALLGVIAIAIFFSIPIMSVIQQEANLEAARGLIEDKLHTEKLILENYEGISYKQSTVDVMVEKRMYKAEFEKSMFGSITKLNSLVEFKQ